MTALDRAAVKAAVAHVREIHAWRAGGRQLDYGDDAIATVLAELERLGRALADVDMTFKLGHGGAWCVACHGAMREGTPVVKALAVVCEPCAADLAATAGRLDPSRLAVRDEREADAEDEGDVPCFWCHCDGCNECTGIHGNVCGCRNAVQR